MAQNKQFNSLVNCWTAMNGHAYRVSTLKQSFHLVHVLRFNEKIPNTPETVLGKDNFLVFNHNGAHLLTPTVVRPIPYNNGMNNYEMTVIPPGETNKVQIGYHISLKSNNDIPGWYGAPGWSKEADTSYAKYEKDPVKPMDFNKARDIMRAVIKSKAQKAAVDIEKTKESLNFWVKAEYYSIPNGFSTRLLPNGEINFQRLAYETKRVEKEISLINSCSELDDETIQLAVVQQKETLHKLKDFLQEIPLSVRPEQGEQKQNSTHLNIN